MLINVGTTQIETRIIYSTQSSASINIYLLVLILIHTGECPPKQAQPATHKTQHNILSL